jgi:hypothetical protein
MTTPSHMIGRGSTHASGKDQSELFANTIDYVIVSDSSEVGIAAACNGGLNCSS